MTNEKIISSFSGDYAFLSNLYLWKFNYKGDWYPSAEHAYQAAKTFDPKLKWQIRVAATPKIAKQLGKTVPLIPMWDEINVGIMFEILLCKFITITGSKLTEKLIDTYPNKLIEGNTWGDTYWGMVYNENTKKWVGQNKLGRLLMLIREMRR